ncbi:hypothetical protein NDU88_007719 [Pleurodeles waltl]|uniref:Uncharacterized protein n=1 Tax=Pleurodeles waltl TaxID=8319 RepID=A0AAV7NVQ1_PLEWA|nr:hypothetical protein NDU88_007719 [Pleurodeles waltl]
MAEFKKGKLSVLTSRDDPRPQATHNSTGAAEVIVGAASATKKDVHLSQHVRDSKVSYSSHLTAPESTGVVQGPVEKVMQAGIEEWSVGDSEQTSDCSDHPKNDVDQDIVLTVWKTAEKNT